LSPLATPRAPGAGASAARTPPSSKAAAAGDDHAARPNLALADSSGKHAGAAWGLISVISVVVIAALAALVFRKFASARRRN
jgi:hypothetical protein